MLPRLITIHPSIIHPSSVQGFKKVRPDRWEFANDGFLRGKKQLLKYIKRRKSTPHSITATACAEIGAQDCEVQRLRRDDKNIRTELVNLRRDQEANRSHLESVEARLLATEQKQKMTISLLFRMLQSPGVFHQPSGRRGKESSELQEIDVVSSQHRGRDEEEVRDRDMNEEFWKELLNDNIEEVSEPEGLSSPTAG